MHLSLSQISTLLVHTLISRLLLIADGAVGSTRAQRFRYDDPQILWQTCSLSVRTLTVKVP